MKDTFYKKMFEETINACACHRIILNEEGEPCDYEFLEVNNSFENITGFISSNIIGKTLREVIPEIENEEFNLIKEYGEVAINGTSKSFVQYFSTLNRYYSIKAFSPEKFFFITIFREVSESEFKLEENEKKYKMIIENMSESLWILDMDFNFSFINSPSKLGLDYIVTAEDVSCNYKKIMTPNSFQKLLNFFNEHIDIYESKENISEKKWVIEIEFFRSNLSTILTESTICYLIDNENNPIGLIGITRDITETKRVQEELQKSEKSKALLLSNLPGMAYRCNYDKDWTMQFVSEGCYELTLYKAESLINNKEISFNALINSDYQECLWETWTKVLKEKTKFREEYQIITAAGELKWVLEQGQGIYDENGEVEAIEGLIIDITEQKKREEEIRYLNSHDALTGLYNRMYYEIQKKRLDNQKMLPFSIIIGDINGLKLINDAFGHAKGDILIKEAARILKSCCRKGDVVSRIGGDEFCILLPQTDSKTTYEIIKKIKEACSEYNKSVVNDAYFINISLGFNTKINQEDDLEKIIKAADDYMYKRKLLERNSSQSAIISSIKATMFESSHETEEHAERLVILSRKLGTELRLAESELNDIELFATLHDIGKVCIDSRILYKPGKLTDEEWREMKKHPEIGYRIAMSSPNLMQIAEYILAHHERWDGKGYPSGLKGENIPLLSRILAVVDAYDAMTQDRPYRKTLTKEEAIEEIKNNSGTQFDPIVAWIFINMFAKLN